jgi:bifunctional non-homologous end joining protein LigD
VLPFPFSLFPFPFLLMPEHPLTRYRAKRHLEGTPEPGGALAPAGGHLFVVHKHDARRLHYDLRLEMEGVLRSWAVPKGPSYDPADKRLAVHVEDHPVEYGNFEGKIPVGNYGAGAVIVWDRGRWTPVGDPLEGLAKGKLLFRLDGYKLHGMWTLVKLKKDPKGWLLIKERDVYAGPGHELPQGSVLSGLTVEDVGVGVDLTTPLLAALAKAGAPKRGVTASRVELMLAETAEKPFTREGWLFELKLDGYRLLAARDGADVRLLSRNHNDLTETFPELALAFEALPFDSFILDGEVVALDDAGRPSFQRLQQRGRLRNAKEIKLATVDVPVTYYAFDLLAFGGYDLRPLPLAARKTVLQRVVPALGTIRYVDHIEREGEQLFSQTERMGLEGLMAKKADSTYRAGRSGLWLKMRAARTDDFVVVGFTAPKGSRTGLGALHLAQFQGKALVYSGRVGSGFSDRDLAKLRKELEAKQRATAPCERVPADAKGSTWVEPELVCEVRFTEWTDDGLLRQPVFLRWRDDKRPEDCVGNSRPHDGGREEATAAPDPDDPPDPPALHKAARIIKPPAAHEPLQLTNLKKVFWPEERYTKGDLLEYYRAIAPWLLPYLKGRPVVLTRYPDGIEGKSFYQKDAPDFIPGWIRTTPIWSEDTAREIRYFVCDDLDSLLYVVNLGAIPLHLWSSRADTLERPDWCVMDLDPKEAPFSDVLKIARRLHKLCDDVGLPNYIKTTGKTGLHVMVPLGRQCTWDMSKSLGELLARVILREMGDITTITRHIRQRGTKVYLDYLQNRHGQLIVAPFSVRPLPGAPVSMPLEWKEVTARLDPRAFTIRTALDRMHKLKHDPLAPVLTEKPDLDAALDRLAQEMK